MRHIWFIRHAESESNANLITIHPAESALTEKGEAQAQQIAAYVPRRPQLIVTSPYLRARQTAQPTIERFDSVPVDEWPVQEFTYLAPQRYYNTTGKQRREPTRQFIEREDPHFKDAGVGESFAELVSRLAETSRLMQEVDHDFTLVFSHGWYIRALLWYLLDGDPGPNPPAFRRFINFSRGVMAPNGTVLKLAVSENRPPRLYGYDLAAPPDA